MKFSKVLDEDYNQFKHYLTNLKFETEMLENKINSNSSKEDVYNTILITSRLVLSMMRDYMKTLENPYDVQSQYKKIVKFVDKEL